MKLSNEHTLKDLFNRPVFYAAEAREAGIHPSRLSYYVKTNRIERIGHGVYRGAESSIDADFQWEDLIIIAKSSSRAIFSQTFSCLKMQFNWIMIPGYEP